MLRDRGNKRFNLDFLPMVFLAVFLSAEQLHPGSEEVSSQPVSVPETVRTWVEVEYPHQLPCVRGLFSPPLLAEVIPGSGWEGEKRLENGTRVRVFSRKPLAFRLDKMPGSHLLLFGQKINVNLARRRDLEAIPGIGPVLAQRIVLYRQEHGNFQDLSELLGVRGIGPKSLSKIDEYLTINLND